MAQRTSKGRGHAPEAARQRSLWTYLSTRPNWTTEILFATPVFLLYQVGTFFSNERNGVDFVTTLLFRLRIASEHAFLGITAVAAAAVLWLFLRTRRREQLQIRHLGPVLLESGLYALLMGNAILFVMTRLLGLPPPSLGGGGGGAAQGMDTWMVFYVSAGAGLYEELVFRVLIFGGLLYALTRVTRLHRAALVILALAVSAALFSAAHHLPPHGEPFTLFAFVYRLFAGAVFGLLYHWRGLACAVYTHFLYDVLVLGVWS